MRRTLPLLVVMALSVMAPVSSHAQTTFGGEVFGAFNTYKMEEVNDAIDAANAAGSEFDELSNGIGGGLGARLWANPNWMFSMVWEPLFLTTESASTSEEFKLDANSFQLTGAYFFPAQTNSKYGLGAGVGYYVLNGEISDALGTTDVKGSGPGFHVLGMGEWTVSPGFAVTAGAGYRFADITIDDTDPESKAEYSGFMGRVGLAFYLSSSAPSTSY